MDQCLTVYSPQALRDNLGTLQGLLNKNKGIVASVPKVIPTINWDEWAATVPAEQLAQIKADYEALTFPAPKESSSGAAVEQFVNSYVEAIAPVTENSAAFLGDMDALKARFQEDYITMADWEPEDWARRFPGLVDKVRARHLVGDITEDDNTTKFIDIDSNALAADVRAGIPINPDLPEDIEEYYFGGVATEGDFPNTPKEFLDAVTQAKGGEEDQSAAERANASYQAQYGGLWSTLFKNLN
jgi:hypothetical protein